MPRLRDNIVGDAFPKGCLPYRHWLSREWSKSRATALVIGINPNRATEAEEDGMTRFLIELLSKLRGKFTCGRYVLVNCCDLREPKPTNLEDKKSPFSPRNLPTIRRMLARSDFVVASWGTTDYGLVVSKVRGRISALLRKSGKPVICFSPIGQPIYCSRTNMNGRGHRWSNKPVPWSGA
jgi:hypothetical protein